MWNEYTWTGEQLYEMSERQRAIDYNYKTVNV